MVYYAPMGMTAAQCRMARTGLGLSNADLAARASVGVNTVSRFEQGSDARGSSIDAMQRALEEAGAIFLGDNEVSLGGGIGVRLRPPA